MTRYRSNPVEIDAAQFRCDRHRVDDNLNDVANLLEDTTWAVNHSDSAFVGRCRLTFGTHSGTPLTIREGDWIVRFPGGDLTFVQGAAFSRSWTRIPDTPTARLEDTVRAAVTAALLAQTEAENARIADALTGWFRFASTLTYPSDPELELLAVLRDIGFAAVRDLRFDRYLTDPTHENPKGLSDTEITAVRHEDRDPGPGDGENR